MIFLIQLQEEMKSLALLSLLALVSITLSQKGQKGEAGAQGAPGLCTGSCSGGGGVSEQTIIIIHNYMHHAPHYCIMHACTPISVVIIITTATLPNYTRCV